MREHAHLSAVVGFVSQHVAQHFRANRPGTSPPVPVKILNAATAAERFREHVDAASGALRQGRAGLLWRAVRAIEFGWDLQVRSGQPDPLAADVMHVGENCSDGAGAAGRFSVPCSRVQMLDQNLVHAIVRGKNLNCGLAEPSLNFRGMRDGLTRAGFTRGHRSYS